MSTTDSPTDTVDRAFAAGLYDAGDTGLDTGASLLAADPSADAEVARRGREFVAAAWRRGWQPADVERIVRRELADAHVRLASALIRAQAPDDRPRGRRWAAQLEALPSQEPPRTDRFTHATTVLELYRLLLRLPTLESLEEPRRHASPAGTPRPTPACSPASARCSPRPRPRDTRRRPRRSPPRRRS
ncbi:hypothetical protein GCM10020256_33260 [Streptomyces thermocoprophilus]